MSLADAVNSKQAKALVAILGSLLLTGASFFGVRVYDYDSRITTLETQRVSDSARLERIEDKVDRVLERMP